MRLRAGTVLALAALAAGSLVACGGDDDDGNDGERAQDYSLQVERISDEAYDAAQDGLVTLNNLSDGSVDANEAIGALDRSSKEVTDDSARLADIPSPEGAAAIADDLTFQLDSLARSLDEAAATIGSARANGAALRDTGRAFARAVLAYQSGAAALSRALRTSVVNAED